MFIMITKTKSCKPLSNALGWKYKKYHYNKQIYLLTIPYAAYFIAFYAKINIVVLLIALQHVQENQKSKIQYNYNNVSNE